MALRMKMFRQLDVFIWKDIYMVCYRTPVYIETFITFLKMFFNKYGTQASQIKEAFLNRVKNNHK